MKSIIILSILFWSITVAGQTVADFEEYNLPVDTFANGSDGSGGFSSGGIFLANDFSTEFDAWTGWALSTKMDTASAGFFNQYSSITGGGANASNTYGVGYAFDPIVINLQEGFSSIEGLFICNATYPYLSMRDGDAFSKKFGGISGADPDFFKLTIRKYDQGELSTDSIDFFLADFRSDNPEEDYILKDWTYVDLSSLGDMDSLSLSLSSSDVGIFGMNTPAYFCVDQIASTSSITAIRQKEVLPLQVYPNPASDFVHFSLSDFANAILTIYGFNGRLIYRCKLDSSYSKLDIRHFPAGYYHVQIKNKNLRYHAIFSKY